MARTTPRPAARARSGDRDQPAQRHAGAAERHQVEGEAAEHHQAGADAVERQPERLEDQHQREDAEADDRPLDDPAPAARSCRRRPGRSCRARSCASPAARCASKTWVWPGRRRRCSAAPTRHPHALVDDDAQLAAAAEHVQQGLGAHRLDQVDLADKRRWRPAGRSSSKVRGRMPSVTWLPGGRRRGRRSTAERSLAVDPKRDASARRRGPRPRASIRFICGVPMKLATNTLAGLAKISCGLRDLLDQAVAHDGDAVGHGQRLELVVGDDDRRLGEVGQHLLDLAAHGLAQLHVEARQRLVEQEAVGIADDGAADGDALLLALGELARQAVEHVVEMQDVARPRRRARRSRRGRCRSACSG